jgi:hypothetical protein
MKFFRRMKAEPPVQELPRTREELLLGDTSLTWTINDFVIHPKLTGLYAEIETSLTRVFERGSFDAANGDHFDGSISAACAIALNDLNSQYSLRPEGINKMVSWRERDVSELRCQLKRRQENVEAAGNELEHYKARLESLNFKKRGV